MKKLILILMVFGLFVSQMAFAENVEYTPMYTVKAVNIDNNGMNIYGELYMPDTGLDTYPVVILSHGYGVTHYAVETYTIALAEAGYGCFVFDFCGGGYGSKSDGTMDDMTISREISDLNAVINAVQAMDKVDENNLFLLGESQGGFVSALVAAQRPDDIRAMMLLYPAFVIPDNCKLGAKGAYEITGMEFTEAYCEDGASYDVFSIIPNYKNNVIIFHGDEDFIVPHSYSEEAASVYESAELITIPGSGHGFGEYVKPEVSVDCIEFIAKNTVK